jgi:hypothetical protein
MIEEGSDGDSSRALEVAATHHRLQEELEVAATHHRLQEEEEEFSSPFDLTFQVDGDGDTTHGTITSNLQDSSRSGSHGDPHCTFLSKNNICFCFCFTRSLALTLFHSFFEI